MRKECLTVAVAALAIAAVSTEARADWSAWDYLLTVDNVEFEVQYNDVTDGTHVRFRCHNRSNVRVECSVGGPAQYGNKLYICRDGSQDIRSSETMNWSVDPGESSQTVPDYNVCGDGGGVRRVEMEGRVR